MVLLQLFEFYLELFLVFKKSVVDWIAFWFLELTLSNICLFLQLLSSLDVFQIRLKLLLRSRQLMQLLKKLLLRLKPSALLVDGWGESQIFFRLSFLGLLAVVFALFLDKPLDITFLSDHLLAFLNHFFLCDFRLGLRFLWGSCCELIDVDVNAMAINDWEVLGLVVVIWDGGVVKSLSLTFVNFLSLFMI